jgi:hypothetical protein
MKKQFFAVAAVIFLTLPAAMNAQQTGTFQLISLDIGYAPGWSFKVSDTAFPQSFALNIKVADGFTTGFQSYIDGAAKANLLNMKYDFLPGKVRGIVAIGKAESLFDLGSDAIVAGLGFEYIPFTRNIAGSVTTEFKIGVQYLFATEDVTTGAVAFNIAFGIGV